MADKYASNDTPWREKTTLERLYVDEALTTKEISARLGCTRQTVEDWINRHSLKRAWDDPSRIRELRDQGFSQREIADQLGCKQGTISNRMQEFEIDPAGYDPQPWHDKDVLWNLYWNEGLDMSKIADGFDCSRFTIRDWMQEHEIPTRTIIESPPEELTYPEWLSEQYTEKKRSTYDIADELDCAPSTVWDYLHRHEIETRQVGMHEGELNHQWKGGVSQHYGATWPDKRREARERDNHECQRCGMSAEIHRESHNETLQVHHIRPFREFDDPEDAHQLENPITLCRECHCKWEGLPIDNREEP
jgi:transposase